MYQKYVSKHAKMWEDYTGAVILFKSKRVFYLFKIPVK